MHYVHGVDERLKKAVNRFPLRLIGSDKETASNNYMS
jgi:hypothetical protein